MGQCFGSFGGPGSHGPASVSCQNEATWGVETWPGMYSPGQVASQNILSPAYSLELSELFRTKQNKDNCNNKRQT